MNHRLAQLYVKLHVLLMLQAYQFTICAIAVVHSNVPGERDSLREMKATVNNEVNKSVAAQRFLINVSIKNKYFLTNLI